MNPLLKNILAVLAGILAGGLLNMALIQIGPSIIPPPEGMDPTDMESLKAFMPQMKAKHFIFPFLGHALGTLFGAAIAARFAESDPMRLSMFIGGFFLLGGIMMVMSLPSPIWFSLLDLLGAYIPMAWLGYKIGKTPSTSI
ncbi:MAG: hypothetical protein AAF696_30235 [Bacteroidota bacterium]